LPSPSPLFLFFFSTLAICLPPLILVATKHAAAAAESRAAGEIASSIVTAKSIT
jgi:hypothetical protein